MMHEPRRRTEPFRRTSTRAAAAVLMALCALLWTAAPPATAETGTPPPVAPAPVTWSVSPADAQGPLKQAWLELELDPGAAADRHLAVRNLGDREVTFAITAADGYFTKTGRFNMLPSDATSVAAGTWIKVQKAVTVAAGGTEVVPFTVTVPSNATPGDHAAGIAASILTQGGTEGAQVNVESRVGFRVMTRVKGELRPELAVSPQGSYAMTWNPLAPGAATVRVDLENTGNVRLKVSATAPGSAQAGAGGEAGEPTQELLPGDKRSITLKVPGVWPLGAVTLPVTLAQEQVAVTGESVKLEPGIHPVTVWAMPWPQLAVLAALALLALGLLQGRRRQKKHVQALIAQAREQGRQDAQGVLH